jgi:hypothetical protein
LGAVPRMRNLPLCQGVSSLECGCLYTASKPRTPESENKMNIFYIIGVVVVIVIVAGYLGLHV